LRTHWREESRLIVVALSAVAVGLFGMPVVAAAATDPVRINEVESNGGTPGDWVELVNTGSVAADVSGWVIKDNDNSHVFTISSGTSLAPGGYLALDVDPVYGLGSADSARLFRPGGSTLVDTYTWTAHATTTYGRCADGTGAFTTTTASTKGAANACPVPINPWPGDAAVAVADGTNVFGTNLSGLAFQSTSVVWAVRNGPSRLYRLVPNGSIWQPDPAAGWGTGKALRYGNGSGDPDAEGVVSTPDGVFAVTERDNNNSGVSLSKILRFDVSSPASSLNATAEWNLTADLPAVAANSGPEGISWVPDTFLTTHGFRDEHTNAVYDPATYPGHGSGLYFVGLEANGTVYAYALNLSSGGYTRVATISTGFSAVMDLEFEPETGHLWAACDDTCQGRAATLDINAQGRFAATAVYNRPTGMSNYNNEGFAIAPQAACAAGRKPVLWADDGNTGSHALRSGTLPC
jgi:hypothetical protein